jgi:hypothetical protein
MTRHVTFMTIDDVTHYTEQQKAEIVARYPAHEREARAKGIPVFGGGRVFPVTEESIRVDPFAIPDHFAQINGLDFGWNHPFAAARCAYDKDNDVFYVIGEYRQSETTPVVHAAAIKPWGEWIPNAWPHDGMQHEKSAGVPLAAQYDDQGLNMLPVKATFEDGSNSVEAGVIEILDRMQTGRFKVFSNCGLWFGEFRIYHRDKDTGLIVKEHDDLISASRYAYMMRRFADTKPRERKPREKKGWMA